MSFASSEKNVYSLLNVLIQTINKHAEIEGYAIVKDRFKRFKKSVLIKAFVKCDAYNEVKFVSNERRVTYN